MGRYLILCIDGTWNSALGPANRVRRTNVARIYELLRNDGERQCVKYIAGVGTEGGLDRIFGGVWGGGVTWRIREGYEFLCRNYQPGDRIALFGFSRGAFVARAIVGVIANFGILPLDALAKIDLAIAFYRRPRTRWTREHDAFRRQHSWSRSSPIIEFLGLWDTVIRYGPILAPLQVGLHIALARTFGLLDRRAPVCVVTIAHALALDECRIAFLPWRFEKHDHAEFRHQRIEELWFAGSHSDVGGGNRDPQLSKIALHWIISSAEKVEIEFTSIPSLDNDAFLAPIEDSRGGIWRYHLPLARTVEPGDRFHESVYRRAEAIGYIPRATMPDNVTLVRPQGC